jgi:hypothetical protein
MKLLLRPEIECFPLWVEREGESENVDPASLPLSWELIQALDDWRTCWDATYEMADPVSAGFPSPALEQQFRQDGDTLATRLRTELGHDWTVDLRVPE